MFPRPFHTLRMLGLLTLLVLAQISEAGRDGAATNNKMHGSSWSVTSLINNCPI